MRSASLGRGLLFALFAALGAVAWPLVLARLLGFERSLALYQLALVVLAAFALAPSARRAVAGSALAGVLCIALALTDPPLSTAVLGVLVVLCVTRSVLAGGMLARRLWFELLLALASCLLFALLYDGTLISGAFATWGFWLAQSGSALLAPSPAQPVQPPRDPFEAAAAAAERLMERRG